METPLLYSDLPRRYSESGEPSLPSVDLLQSPNLTHLSHQQRLTHSQSLSLPSSSNRGVLPEVFKTGFLVYIPWLPQNTSPQHLYSVLLLVLRSLRQLSHTRNNSANTPSPPTNITIPYETADARDFIIGKDYDCRLFVRPETSSPFAILAFESRGIAIRAIPRLRRRLLQELNSVLEFKRNSLAIPRRQSPNLDEGLFMTSSNQQLDLDSSDSVSIGSIDSRGTEVVACFPLVLPRLGKASPIENRKSRRDKEAGVFEFDAQGPFVSDTESSMTSSDDGEDSDSDDDCAPTTIRVTGLPSRFSLTSLVQHLSEFGEIVFSDKTHVMTTPTFVSVNDHTSPYASPSSAGSFVTSDSSESSAPGNSHSTRVGGNHHRRGRSFFATEGKISVEKTSLNGSPESPPSLLSNSLTPKSTRPNQQLGSTTLEDEDLSSTPTNSRRFHPTQAFFHTTPTPTHTTNPAETHFREFPRRKHASRLSLSSSTTSIGSNMYSYSTNNFTNARNSFVLNPGALSPFIKQVPSFNSLLSLSGTQRNIQFQTQGGMENGEQNAPTYLMRSDIAAEALVTFKHSQHAARAVVALHGTQMEVCLDSPDAGEVPIEKEESEAEKVKLWVRIFAELRLE
ncbi:hypothetical protein HK098_006372 [Nowakowskiella sp. JEL0407]|nr:hypothetical protein HK098_006372 [Nowakowskiella sp. JEL0407]